MTLLDFCEWLQETQIGTAIRESQYLFPVIEGVHVLGIILLIGTVALLDLRLLGVLFREQPVSRIASSILPLTWIGFAVMLVSGVLLFWASAGKLYTNPAFRLKLLLLVLAGLNPLLFHVGIYRAVHDWEQAEPAPWRARATAVASLTLWSGIVVTGRAIAFL